MTFNDGPKVFLVASTAPRYGAMQAYLKEVGGESWLNRILPHQDMAEAGAENLVEFAGRLCYRSWVEGLNPNVTKIRTDQGDYLRNILKQAHGSVLEHATYSFVFHNVSRILTHELFDTGLELRPHKRVCAMSGWATFQLTYPSGPPRTRN